MSKNDGRLPALLAAGLLVTHGLVTACASPTGPSTTPVSSATPQPTATAPVTLTVRVLRRSVETPLEGAVVHVASEAVRADASGICQFSLLPGQLASVEVSAAGFLPLSASGVLHNDERWTFWLEHVEDTP